MARRAWIIAAALVLAAQSVAAQDRTWDVSVKLAEKTMEPQPGWDFVPINDPANCLLVLELAVVYLGPAGPVPAPRVAVEDEGGRKYHAWGNTACNMADNPCFDAMDWVLSATHSTSDTRELSTGDTISTGSLTYYFAVPRAVAGLRLRFGDDEPLALELSDVLARHEAAQAAARRMLLGELAAREGRANVEGPVLFNEMQAALGGAEALARIADYVRETQTGVPGESPRERRTVRWIKAGPVRWDEVLPGDRRPWSTVLEDGAAWRQGPRDKEPIEVVEDEYLFRIRGEAGAELLGSLLCGAGSDCTVRSYFDRTLQIDRPGLTISMELGEEGVPVRRRVTSGGNVVEEALSDWRLVDGIMLPFRVERSRGGSVYEVEVTVEWRLNVGLTADELRKLR